MMRKILFVVLGLSLAACTEYPGAKTNCWTKVQPVSSSADVTRTAYSPTVAFVSTRGSECDFEPIQ